jgi:diguanylate cyclase (GGDEF)-like protein
MSSGRSNDRDAQLVAIASGPVGRTPGRGVAVFHALALALAAVVAVLTSGLDQWSTPRLAVIAVFTIVSDLSSVQTGSAKLKVSGSFLGLVLAAVVLGGGPAALVGMATIIVGWLRWREAGHYLRNNLVTYAWFPLIGGLFFHAGLGLAHVGAHAIGYYLLVFAAFVVALAVNFVGVAGYQCYLDGHSLLEKARDALAPVLASELFSALLTMVAVYFARTLGTVGLGLIGLVLVIFQYLVGELLVSKIRSHELKRMASTDELTGLANREQFRVRLETEIEESRVSGATFGVFLMDLDRFKEVNDTLGHHYGDLVLSDLGPRLAAAMGPDGVVARLGGDEFAVLPGERTTDRRELEHLAARLLACVRTPLAVEELSLEIGASVGISRYPLDGEDPHTLLRRADVAMYAAKESHGGSRFYAADQDQAAMRRLSVTGDFRRALSAGEIVVHFQPIVDLSDLQARSAEGLVRWEHPEHGLLPPAAFIHAIEQTGLIGPLTRHVLERSIAQCAQWRREGRDLSVAVNLSVRNLLDRGLPREIERLLSAHGLPPEALQLEITESMLMADPERALATVTRISALGVRFAVDDFGTGYSSLAYLRRLPIDELKIDRSFVSPMLQDSSDLIIVRSTINLAHDLGLRIIAEGVEDEPTMERLGYLGCDLAQGFHFSRPMAAEAFSRWLAPAGPAVALLDP